MRGGRRRNAAGREGGGARCFGPARQAQTMHLSDHRVAGHAIAEQARDLARALAVNPMLLELFDYLVCPSHLSPRLSYPSPKAAHYAESNPVAWRGARRA